MDFAIKWVCCCLFGTLFAGCATDVTWQKDVDELRQRVQSLEAKYAIAASHFDEMDRINQLSYAIQDRVEDIGLEQNKHARAIVQLQRNEQNHVPGYVERRPAQPQPRQRKPMAPVAQKPEARPTDANVDGNAQEVYSRAYALLQEKRYRESSDLFAYIMQRFPKDELADNALYWMAEIDYNSKDYINALKKFESLPQKFPRGNKVPAARLKAAFCYAKLGDRAKARQVADQLIKEFPWSTEAEKAMESKNSGELQ